MTTTCYICGKSDGSDLSGWGQSPDYGFYHQACAATLRQNIRAARARASARISAAWLYYPPDWPACPGCGGPAIDGHVTCGAAQCAAAAKGGVR